MKVIKKYFKLVMCFMAFALCSFLMVFAPTMTAMATASSITNYAKEINSVQMKKVVDANEGLVIPFLNGTFANNGYTIKVVDPAGYVHAAKVNNSKVLTEDGNGYFDEDANGIKVTALTAGNYQVVYVVTEGSGTTAKEFYSNIYNVTVKNVSYELNFTAEDGAINLIKPEVNAGEKIEVPVPYAVDENGNKVQLNPEKEISVSYNGTTVDLSKPGAETEFFKDDDGKYYIQTKVVNEDVKNQGVYKVQYTYKRGVNRPTKTISIKVTKGFETPEDFKVSSVPTFNKFELGQTGIELPKLTAKNEYQSNVEYNLTSLRIEKESNSAIYQELCADELNNYKFDMTLEAFEGVDLTKGYEQLKGNYVITYTIKGAYENNETTYKKRIENVTVSSKPTIKMVYDYTATGTMFGKDFETSANPETAETQLQNKYGYNQIILPAVYAEDAVSKSNELIVVRYLRNVNSSTIYYVDNLKYNAATGELEEVQEGETGYNYSDDANIGNINNAVQFKFAADEDKAKTFDGTYQLEYRVIAKNIAKRENTLTVSGSTKYTFEVLPYALEEYKATTPTVEINNLVDGVSVDRNEKLNVNITAKDDDDTRLKNVVYYYYGPKASIKATTSLAGEIKENAGKVEYNADRTMHALDRTEFHSFLNGLGYTGLTQAKLNEDGTGYVVEFDNKENNGTNKTAEAAMIVVVSYNDYGNVKIDARKVEFKDTEDDAVPTATIVDTGDFNSDCSALEDSSKAKIGQTIVLPTINYVDTDNTLLTNVSYYIGSPLSEKAGLNYLTPSNMELLGNKIVGGELTIEKAGNYVIVYSATDDAGNTTVSYFTFSVESNTKPLLSVNPTGEDITISGNTITAEAGTTISFDAILRDGDTKEMVTGTTGVKINNNGLSYTASGERAMSYTFNGVGKYTLTFTGSYNGKTAVDKVVYVNITARKLEWLGEFNLPEYAETGADIYLPDVAASDNAKVELTVTPPNGSKLENPVEKVSEDNEGNKGSFWHFVTNNTKGNYTIKYTATTADATLEKTFTIKVGDNVPPTIEFEHKSELEQDIVYDGTNQIQIKFDVKKTGAPNERYFKIKATSNGETIYSYNLGLDLTDITDGSTTPQQLYWTNLKYEIVSDSSSLTKDSEDVYLISGTGTFTIKLTMTDDNGNETVENIVFKVVDKAEAEEKNDTVVGVVLIVISLVVLAGVILFFMFTGKKGSSKKTKKVVKSAKAKAQKVEDKKEEVKVEVEEKVEEVIPATEESTETVEETADETVEESTEAKEGEIEE